MSPIHPPADPLTLANCDREPIHIPGAIQPHGALLAFDRTGRLSHASANAPALLGVPLDFGRPLRPEALADGEAAWAPVLQAIAAATAGAAAPQSQEARIGGHSFDVVVHGSGAFAVCEFEPRVGDADEIASFAQKAYRSMDAIKRQRSVARLLEAAVADVRALTGFDRVMAYRFRHDDSGDIVAEARREDLEPYLGRRYPASDIPAQARRLYTLNTLRLIADVAAVPVPLLADAACGEPLDLSHGVLRTVSPVHIEYLRNMGVAASMSVSIVVAGKLWGMLACHHMAPRQLPYSIRMAADVMAQLLAASVQSLAAQAREQAMAKAAWLRTEVTARLSRGEEARNVLASQAAGLQEGLQCDALLFTLDGKLSSHGSIDTDWARALLGWLKAQPHALVHVSRGSELPAAEPGAMPPYCGLLGLRFDAPHEGWIVGLRREQIQTIRWGGRPEKEIAHGPLGPRLTPRGSFDEWRETVNGTAEPWNETELEIASQLLDAVSRVHSDRALELDRLRSQLWAVLGHDLRNPLQSLTMAATVLTHGGAPGRVSTVIQNSTDRMQRLMQDVLDISHLQNGLGLGIIFKPVDLVPLLKQLVEEIEMVHPQLQVTPRFPDQLEADADLGRLAQLLGNLLSNARHHGLGDVELKARAEDGSAVLEVSNRGGPIDAEVVQTLFDPFKRRSVGNERNRGGMGLGLYIADQIVRGHRGTLSYVPGDGVVTFQVRIPLRQAADG